MPFLTAALVAAATYGAGAAVAAAFRLEPADPLRRAASAFALGFAALAALVLVVGVAGAFTRPVLVGMTAACGAVGLLAAARDAPQLARAWRESRHRAVIAATAAIVLVDVVLSAAPPTSGDALAYHLTAPKLWLDAGRIAPIWWDWQTFQPFAAEMHFGLALALSDGRAAMVVGALLSGFSAVCVYGLGRELAGARVGALAALLWVAQGMFLWEATGAFVEVALGGFVALAAWHLACFSRDARLRDAVLAGIALGAGVATKYHALVFAPAFVVGVLLLARGRERRLLALAALAAGALVGIPWYVKNWIVAGNPVYPLFLGGKRWSAADQAFFDGEYAGYGLHGIWRLPIFPLEFLLRADRYERGYSFSPALFALAPVGVLLGGRRARLLGGALVLYILLWWTLLHQITRFLVPVLPFAAVLAAEGAFALWDRGPWARRGAAAVGVATGAALAAITGLFAWQVLPGVLGTESQAAYVQRLTGTYDAQRWLDTRLPRGGKVLVIGMRNLYYLERPYVRMTPPLFNARDAQPVTLREMRRQDVRYIAWLGGEPSGALARQVRPVATLQVPLVTSRTLARVEGTEEFRIYAWCAGRGDPCRAAAG